jgi:hypothetical protein
MLRQNRKYTLIKIKRKIAFPNLFVSLVGIILVIAYLGRMKSALIAYKYMRLCAVILEN